VRHCCSVGKTSTIGSKLRAPAWGAVSKELLARQGAGLLGLGFPNKCQKLAGYLAIGGRPRPAGSIQAARWAAGFDYRPQLKVVAR